MMQKEAVQRSFPECNLFNAVRADSTLVELTDAAAEAIGALLAPEVEVVQPPSEDWNAIDEGWFATGVAVENLLARQGTDPGDGELDPVELEALRASERSRGGA